MLIARMLYVACWEITKLIADDLGRGVRAEPVEHVEAEELHVRGDPGDDPRHVGAVEAGGRVVTQPVVRARSPARRRPCIPASPATQQLPNAGARVVDAGVQHRDGRARAREPAGRRGGLADQREALGQEGLLPPVRPDADHRGIGPQVAELGSRVRHGRTGPAAFGSPAARWSSGTRVRRPAFSVRYPGTVVAQQRPRVAARRGSRARERGCAGERHEDVDVPAACEALRDQADRRSRRAGTRPEGPRAPASRTPGPAGSEGAGERGGGERRDDQRARPR